MIEFSAVIPTYNRGLVITETLAAIHEQRYPAAEVIVVDDGSSDGTGDIVKSTFPTVKYIRIANVGTGAARKAAAEMATKDWIAFCDDDDIWLPDHLERRAKLIERFPNASFTYSNFRAFGPSARPNYTHFASAPSAYWESAIEIEDGEFFLLKQDAFRYFLRFNSVYPFTTAVRRDFYHEVGGINPRYSRLQPDDIDYLLRSALKTRIAGDSHVTGLHRRHKNQQTGNQVPNLISPARIVADQLKSEMVPPEYREEANQFIISMYKEGFLHAFWNRDFEAMGALVKEHAEIKKDFNILSRYVFSNIARRFGWNGF
jgi:glycosyltransferase involved in cell wall biosynthesis